MNFLPDFNKQK